MTDRPRLALSRTRYEWTLDVLSVGLLIAAAVTLMALVPTVEEPAPIHFDLAGNPDRWGSIGHVWWVLVLAVAAFVGMTLLQRVPHHYNYAIDLSSENAERQYRLARACMGRMKVFFSAIFGVMMVAIVVMARGGPPLVHAVWPLVALLFLDLFLYIRRSQRMG
jgi:uncharacterized membrane protein